MTLDRVLELLRIEYRCLRRNSAGKCQQQCGSCDLAQSDADLEEMYTTAAGLLKQLEARIMTLEEALNAPYVWMEANPSGLGIRHIRRSEEDPSILYVESFRGSPTMADADMYGKMFRCWTNKPSPELRQAAGWSE